MPKSAIDIPASKLASKPRTEDWPRIRPRSRTEGGRTWTDWTVDLGVIGNKRRVYVRPNREDAETLAQQIRDFRSKTGDAILMMTPRQVLDAVEACQRLPTGTSLLDVVQYWLEHHTAAGGSGPMAVGEGVDAWLTHCVTEKMARPKTLATAKSTIRWLTSRFGEQPIASVTTDKLEEALGEAEWTSVGVHARTVRYLRIFFHHAHRRGWIERDPADPLDIPQIDRSEPTIWRVAQVKALFDYMDAERDPCVVQFAILFFAGLRPEEAHQLDWDRDVAWDAGQIHVGGTISKIRSHRRYVRIVPSLMRWMGKYRHLPICPPNWPERRRTACAAVGLEWHADISRRTWASHHAPVHGCESTADQMGHLNGIQTLRRHYLVAVAPAQAEAYWSIIPKA